MVRRIYRQNSVVRPYSSSAVNLSLLACRGRAEVEV
jgi:hypothetical protein